MTGFCFRIPSVPIPPTVSNPGPFGELRTSPVLPGSARSVRSPSTGSTSSGRLARGPEGVPPSCRAPGAPPSGTQYPDPSPSRHNAARTLCFEDFPPESLRAGLVGLVMRGTGAARRRGDRLRPVAATPAGRPAAPHSNHRPFISLWV